MNYPNIAAESLDSDYRDLAFTDAANRLADERRFGDGGYIELPEPDEETVARCEACAKRYFGHPAEYPTEHCATCSDLYLCESLGFPEDPETECGLWPDGIGHPVEEDSDG